MFDVASCSIMFDLIFVTFEVNESEHGLSRESVGDELLIREVSFTNLFNDIVGCPLC